MVSQIARPYGAKHAEGQRGMGMSFDSSLFHANRKAKLMGHIARTENNDPLRQITFQADTAYRIQYGKKRVGKPRQNWIHQTKKYIYTQKLGYTSYQEENAQDDTILQNAVARIF